MKCFVLFALLSLGANCAPIQSELYFSPGPFAVAIQNYQWRDINRHREVPAKVYMPEGKGPFPVIIFSHGLGGSKDGYEYLGRHWASHGYVSVHPTHAGSDTSIMRKGERPLESMARAADDPQNAINRPKDVSFVIDQLTSLTLAAGPMHGKLDINNIGVAGHSFGSYTALAVAGESFVGPLGRQFRLGDRRVKAAVAMSTPANRRDEDILDRMYGSIAIPCLHMTGTLDDSPIGTSSAQDRRIPFDHMYLADNYLLILNGGDHMIFSGRRFQPQFRDRDKRFHELILASSTAFWEAYLRGDAVARAWLADGDFKENLDGEAEFEIKLAK